MFVPLALIFSTFATGALARGDEITFARACALYAVRPSGTGLRRVRSRGPGLGCVFDPAWSHDHRQIAFTIYYKESDITVGTVRADGTDRRDDTFDFTLTADPTWSPTARSLAAVEYAGGFPPPTDNTSMVVTTTHKRYRHRRLTNFKARDAEPTWSPDGREVAFTRRAGRNGPAAIFAMPAPGGTPRRITTGADADWSPDGSHLVFGDHGDIFVVSARGASRTLVIGGRDIDSEPRWSPDGKRVAFLRSRPRGCNRFDCAHDIWIADGAHQRLLARKVDNVDW
jgi:Tol biopolymer transport system component